MWHGYARYRDRWAVRQLHAAARAASKQDRAPGSHRHDRAAGGVCGSVTACGADGPAGGRGECAAVVRVDVSYSKTRNAGVDKMRKTVRRASCVIGGAWCVAILLGSPLAAQTSLSIYRDGRVVVRRTLPQALQQGRNTVTVKLDGLDPATLFSPDTAVSVVATTTRAASTVDEALARAIGQTLSFVRAKGDTVRATVLSVTPPQYRLTDGRLLLGSPGEPLFPSELVRTGEEAMVTLEASRGRPRTEVAYVAQGATWEATYQVLLGRGRAWVAGVATVKRPTRSPFGDRPLPAGSVQVYESDSAGRPQLLGEATIDHTPAGSDVRLYTGDAFDVTSEWLQTDWRTEPLQRQPITGAAGPQKLTASYRVTLRNAKADAVTVDVIERHQGEWKVTESSMPAERLSAGEVRFRVPLPAGGSVQLTYTIEAKS